MPTPPESEISEYPPVQDASTVGGAPSIARETLERHQYSVFPSAQHKRKMSGGEYEDHGAKRLRNEFTEDPDDHEGAETSFFELQIEEEIPAGFQGMDVGLEHASGYSYFTPYYTNPIQEEDATATRDATPTAGLKFAGFNGMLTDISEGAWSYDTSSAMGDSPKIGAESDMKQLHGVNYAASEIKPLSGRSGKLQLTWYATGGLTADEPREVDTLRDPFALEKEDGASIHGLIKQTANMSTTNDIDMTAAPGSPRDLTDPESEINKRSSSELKPTFTSPRGLHNDGYQVEPPNTAAPITNVHVANLYTQGPPSAPPPYWPNNGDVGGNVHGYSHPLPNSNQPPYSYYYTPGAPYQMQQMVHRPMLPLNNAMQTQASGDLHSNQVLPATHPGLAQFTPDERLRIVHTTEPDHGQILKHYKLGHHTKTARNTRDAPKSKAKVPQAGGKITEVWRCAKSACSFCNLVAHGYTDLTEALAFAHGITGVVGLKKSYKEKGTTAVSAQQHSTATNSYTPATNGHIPATNSHTPATNSHTPAMNGVPGHVANHTSYHDTMLHIASSGYFARPAGQSLQASHAPQMPVTSSATNHGPQRSEAMSAQSSATSTTAPRLTYPVTNTRQMMVDRTTGYENPPSRQSLARHVSGPENVTTTSYGAETVSPHMLMLRPESEDVMSWTEASSSPEDAYLDVDDTYIISASPYPSEYMEANVRALMAESAPM
ncbi:hypothetical protein LTS09_016758 [Friedmanniomyces endolithicus]|nr:hypothetical protein LTS09_016758 [Friedmanniomyces endolithicus]